MMEPPTNSLASHLHSPVRGVNKMDNIPELRPPGRASKPVLRLRSTPPGKLKTMHVGLTARKTREIKRSNCQPPSSTLEP